MLGELLVEFGFLFGKVLAPILLLVALGALLQKRHPIEMQSLSNLQLYLFIPAFLFVHIADSKLTLGQIAGIAGTILLIQALLALPLYGFLVWRRVPREKLAVVLLASVIFNAGNFALGHGSHHRAMNQCRLRWALCDKLRVIPAITQGFFACACCALHDERGIA